MGPYPATTTGGSAVGPQPCPEVRPGEGEYTGVTEWRSSAPPAISGTLENDNIGASALRPDAPPSAPLWPPEDPPVAGLSQRPRDIGSLEDTQERYVRENRTDGEDTVHSVLTVLVCN